MKILDLDLDIPRCTRNPVIVQVPGNVNVKVNELTGLLSSSNTKNAKSKAILRKTESALNSHSFNHPINSIQGAVNYTAMNF